MNGLELIKKLSVEKNAYLVTGFFENINIRRNCLQLGVRLIPKSAVPMLPIYVAENRGQNNA